MAQRVKFLLSKGEDVSVSTQSTQSQTQEVDTREFPGQEPTSLSYSCEQHLVPAT